MGSSTKWEARGQIKRKPLFHKLCIASEVVTLGAPCRSPKRDFEGLQRLRYSTNTSIRKAYNECARKVSD